MSNIDLVIFDGDGVLVDSEYIAAQVESAAYKAHGFEISAEDFAERFAGLTSAEILTHVEEELDRGIPDTILDDIVVELDERLAAEVQMIESVDTVLENLDFARCICSNSSGDRLQMMLKKTGLHDRFRPYIFSAREVGSKEPKPSPSVFLHAAQEFEVEPKNVMVVEDSDHGIMGAKAAGMRVVGFTGASHTYPGHAEKLMDAGADTTIRRMADLPNVLNALGDWDGLA